MVKFRKNAIQLFIDAHKDLISDVTVDKFYHTIEKHKLYHHMYNCWNQIINSRKLYIGDIKRQTAYASVIIENRQLPGMEYTMRKLVHLLGDTWSHYYFCTDNNYQQVLEMCNNIHANINVIKLPGVDQITHNIYNNICLDREFWNLVDAEKILIHQSDSEILHGGIERFLKFDYVGAPWPTGQNDNRKGVGNGGFSLRTKSVMLKCLETIPPADLELNSSTVSFMNGLKHLKIPLDLPPEDVYYSKAMLDLSIGKIPPPEIAIDFASETSTKSDKQSLGEHQPWLYSSDRIYKRSRVRTLSLMNRNFSGGDAKQHAGGWCDVIHNLEIRGILNDLKKSWKLLDCTEQYFVWDSLPQVTEDWVGIIHITPVTPDYLQIANVNTLLAHETFLSSISKCKLLVTLSNYLKDYIEIKLPDVKVVCIKHPTTTPSDKYLANINSLLNNPSPSLVQIGQQMRYMSTIFEVNCPYEKKWLTGWRDKSKMLDLLYKELEWRHVNGNININEDIITYVETKEEYNNIIKNNIIMIHVIDSSANNALLEMIARNIPVLVNRHPAIAEYLGYDYPLYYYSIAHLQSILNDKKYLEALLLRAHEYLIKLDKTDISHTYFAGQLLTELNDIP